MSSSLHVHAGAGAQARLSKCSLDLFTVPRPSKTKTILGELIFGSVHNFHSGAREPPQFLKKSSENENISCGVPISGNRSAGSCPEDCGFRIAQVVGCHSENGNSYSENGISNSESCSEKIPELSESSENGLFTPRAFFS